MDFIKGENRDQLTLLPNSVEAYVAEDNPVRVIDIYVDQLDFEVLGFAKHRPNDTGRPMYDPKDLMKLYVYGYMNRVRSSRRLEVETRRNLEVIWLLRTMTPDHKTIARFRHDNAAALKNVFRDFVKFCLAQNLYGRELVAIDGSKFRASNSKDRNYNKKKLDERILRIESRIEGYLKEIERNDEAEGGREGSSPDAVKATIAELTARKELYQSYRETIESTGALQLSMTDADSRLMMSSDGSLAVCYNVQTAVDEKNKLIVDFEVTNNVNDKNQLSDRAKAAADVLEVDRLAVLADAGYSGASDAAKCIRGNITPHVAGLDIEICLPATTEMAPIESHENGRAVYIEERNIAVCPMGKILYPKYYKRQARKGVYKNYSACTACEHRCVKSIPNRFEVDMPETVFSLEFDDTDLYLGKVAIRPDKLLLKKRKSIVEHPFGTVKRAWGADYCLTRRLANVTGEFSLTFLAYNLKRAINILGATTMIEMLSV